MKLQTTETESKHLLPSYLVNLLVYFYIKTSNYLVLNSQRELEDGEVIAKEQAIRDRHWSHRTLVSKHGISSSKNQK